MTFNSLQFFAFFAIVLAIYHRLDRRGQNVLIIISGSVFYGAFDWRFLGLLYFSMLVDYSVGRGLAATDDAGRRRALVGVSLTSQLGILGFFKYFDFFARSAADLLDKVGISVDPVVLNIVLPVGISFYTFQTLAYVFAVYRRQLDAERDLTTFAAFVAWFPQLVAGPIERATDLLPQIRRHRELPDASGVESAVVLIVRGLFKKVVIADSIATYVSTVYTNPSTYRWSALLLATVGFAVQVYGDFSGYSDIARGTSRLLGVELRRNFEQPFLSRDMREFWTRWHTSLSWWFVEHVNPALGGATSGPLRRSLNVLILFALIGLWHGAAWTFVLWGVYNGVLVAIWRQRPVPKTRHPMKLRARDCPAIAVTFGLFCVGAAFFRASSFSDAVRVLVHIATLRGGASSPSGAALVPIMLVATYLIDLNDRRGRIRAIETLRIRARLGTVATPEEAAVESMVFPLSGVATGLAIGAMALALLVFSGGTPTPFIYFQF